MNPADIARLVDDPLARVSDGTRRAALEARRVPPSSHRRTSAFVDGEFECWVVARADACGALLVHAQSPFSDPWGCVDPGSVDLGVDSQWFATLDDAFLFGMWNGPMPPATRCARGGLRFR